MQVDFTKWLNDQMKNQNMTQGDLHRASGLSRALISLLLSGKNDNPHLSTIITIADALGVSLDSLMSPEYMVETDDTDGSR